MMEVSVQKITYENYGECLAVSNGTVVAFVSVECGPRILWFGYCGGPNLLFNDLTREQKDDSPALSETYGEGSVYYFYGGHRLWTSPEHDIYSHYPDNSPVDWEKTERGVRLCPCVQAVNDVRHEIELSFGEGAHLTLIHRIENTRGKAQRFAPWSITQLAPGGVAIVPQPTRDTGLLANRVLSVWSYANLQDPRLYLGERWLTVRQDPFNTRALKIGMNSEAGWAAYLNRGAAFIKRFAPWKPDGSYSDFGVNFETYTAERFLELESLGELREVQPGEIVEHVEQWELRRLAVVPDARNEMSVEMTAAVLGAAED